MPAVQREDWTMRAKCRGMEDALFPEASDQKRARLVCSGCPVRFECLAEALDNRIEWGVWGGHDRTGAATPAPSAQRREVLEVGPPWQHQPAVGSPAEVGQLSILVGQEHADAPERREIGNVGRQGLNLGLRHGRSRGGKALNLAPLGCDQPHMVRMTSERLDLQSG